MKWGGVDIQTRLDLHIYLNDYFKTIYLSINFYTFWSEGSKYIKEISLLI